MESTVNMFGKSDSSRSPTRLQRQAPIALNLECVPKNPLLQQSSGGDAVASTAIPLLSPLFVSPSPHSSLSGEDHDFMCPVGNTEMNGSYPHREGQQSSAKGDHINQKALLDMFQTKFVLVDHSK